MKIYVSHPNSIDFKTELYQPLKNSSLVTSHIFFLPHDGGRNENTKDEIQSSDLLIAEVSEPSTGSGIEMGWADSANVPIWCIYREGTKPSGAAKYVAQKHFMYKDSDDFIAILESELADIK